MIGRQTLPHGSMELMVQKVAGPLIHDARILIALDMDHEEIIALWRIEW